MQLILAIEPDKRQAAQLSAVVKRRLDVELILVDTTQRALEAIGNRMPDLVLVPALLSPQDDAALAAALRVIAAAAHVQMLTIPLLGSARPEKKVGGVLSALRRGKSKAVETVGCDPSVFAEQIASYLERAGEERLAAVSEETDEYEAQEAAAPAPDPPTHTESTEAAFEEFVDTSIEVDSPVPAQPDPLESLPEGEPVAETAASEEIFDETVPAAITFAVPATVVEPPIPVVAAEEPDRADVDEPAFSDADVPPPVVTRTETDPESVEKLIGSIPDETVSLALEEAVRALFAGGEETAQSSIVDAGAELPAQMEVASIDAQSEIETEIPDLTEAAPHTAAPESAESVGLAAPPEPQGVHLEPEVLLQAEPSHVELVSASETEALQPDALKTGAQEKDEWEALEDLIAALDAMPLAAIEATSPDEWIAPVVSSEPASPVQKLEAVAPKVPEPEVQPAPAPTATRSEREWVALIESLRHDVERLRNERGEKPARKTAAPRAAKSEAIRPEKEKEKEKEKKTKPIQDEWGFFDPEQCGFAALLAKLDEVTDPEELQGPAAADPHPRSR